MLLSGGPIEHFVDLPFNPYRTALAGDAVYMIGHPDGTGEGAFAICRVSLSLKTTTITLAQPPGFPYAPWFVAYRDIVLWADYSAMPPNLYEIRGNSIAPIPPLDPMPRSDAVLTGSLLATARHTGRDTPSFALHDLENMTTKIFEFRAEDGYNHQNFQTVVGARDEFVFAINILEVSTNNDKLLRLRTLTTRM